MQDAPRCCDENRLFHPPLAQDGRGKEAVSSGETAATLPL